MKVLLADDHALFREGVRLVLEGLVPESMEIVEANDFIHALAIIRESPPNSFDIGLMDLNMPGMNGFAGIEALRRASPDLYLVVISASEDPSDIRRALDAGAQGYITKSSSSAAMLEGIRSVLEGETFICPPIALPEHADGSPASADAEKLKAMLTPRQRDVLGMLRLGKSNKEIARDLNLAEITVKLHVTAILRSLGVDNRTQAAILAAKIGL